MSSLAKQEFKPLDLEGQNFLNWKLDAELYLQAKSLGDTIISDKTVTAQDKAKALIFLRHHIHDDLKAEYLTVKDPLELWKSLGERYDHQKSVILPGARHEWLNLRFQDYQTVSAYNSAMFRITSKLRLCGEKVSDNDMLEKTFSTFHASNVLLQQTYRERKYKKYSQLITVLLVAEKNNELLMKNHLSRPTGSAPLPEVNATSIRQNTTNTRDQTNQRGKGNGRRGNQRFGHNNNLGPKNDTEFKNYHKGFNPRRNNAHTSNPASPTDICKRCGRTGHWYRACRTSKRKVAEYEASKGGGESNLMEDMTHLNINDFYQDKDGYQVSDEQFNAMLDDIPE